MGRGINVMDRKIMALYYAWGQLDAKPEQRAAGLTAQGFANDYERVVLRFEQKVSSYMPSVQDYWLQYTKEQKEGK